MIGKVLICPVLFRLFEDSLGARIKPSWHELPRILFDENNNDFDKKKSIKIGHNEIPGDKLYWKRYRNWYISMKKWRVNTRIPCCHYSGKIKQNLSSIGYPRGWIKSPISMMTSEMESMSALLASSGFPHKGLVVGCFDVFFRVSLKHMFN